MLGSNSPCTTTTEPALQLLKPACLEPVLCNQRSPGEEKGYLHQYSGLENSIDSLWGLKESDTTERLSLFHFSQVSTAELPPVSTPINHSAKMLTHAWVPICWLIRVGQAAFSLEV